MNSNNKLPAGSIFPPLQVKDLNDNNVTLGKPQQGASWQLVLVYRGRHCPLCTKYLNQLESYRDRLLQNGVDVVAVSGDSKAQLQAHLSKLQVSFALCYGLTQEQMQTLGLYISIPRSAEETDHNFAEPGLFVINEEGAIQVIDISNNPFVRPELEALISGLEWIRNPDNNYPIRGTLAY
ncbi:redoxin family protein [bacterium SCSIO 12696]|nr:redoxin family protein [bacterium SCSIO 12696]